MAVSSIPYLILIIMPVFLASPLKNDTKTLVTNARLLRLDTLEHDSTDIRVIIEKELNEYGYTCCSEVNGQHTPDQCKIIQYGYWAWLTKDEFILNKNEMLQLLRDRFDPEGQPPEIQKQMCGKSPAPNPNPKHFPYYAVPKMVGEIKWHVERQLLEKMALRASQLYGQQGGPQKAQFFLHSTNSPCVTGNLACLQRIFEFTARSIIQGYNANLFVWDNRMHKFNVGFEKWFTPYDSGITFEKMREWFCRAKTTTPDRRTGMNSHKSSTFDSDKFNFEGGLSFVKTIAQDKDQDFLAGKDITIDDQIVTGLRPTDC